MPDLVAELAAAQHAYREALRPLLKARWRWGRTLGRTMYARTGGDDYKADTDFGMLDTRELAAEACDSHNAVLDLVELLESGWLAEFGQVGTPGGSAAGYHVSLRRTGDIVSVNFTGETAPEALAKAREWASDSSR